MKAIQHKPLFSEKVKMIYNGKRKKIRLTIDYMINAKKMQDAINEFSAAANDLDESAEANDRLMSAGKNLFSVAFGEATAQEIFVFFENNVIAMADAFTPFIRDVVNKKIQRSIVLRDLRKK